MFFYLSKSLLWFIDPNNIFIVCVALSFIGWFLNWLKWAKIFSFFAFMIFVLVGVLPTGQYLQHQLESRFMKPAELPEDVAGIIVLGGAVNAYLTADHDEIAFNGNVERVTTLLELSKKYPSSKVIFTGGSGTLNRPELKEADFLKSFLQSVLQPENQLVIENNARNTYENALLTKEKIEKGERRPWLLVTSAFHMARSVGAYRLQDIPIIPYPVDYKTTKGFSFGLSREPLNSFDVFRFALHEWLGLFVYYLTDKTSELFPSPTK